MMEPKEKKISLQTLEGGTRRQSKTLEMLMEVHQKIRKNELPILYFAHENTAIIVNFDEYSKQLALLELYRKIYFDDKYLEEDEFYSILKKIKKLQEELDEQK